LGGKIWGPKVRVRSIDFQMTVWGPEKKVHRVITWFMF